jgi:hypothetical protein
MSSAVAALVLAAAAGSADPAAILARADASHEAFTEGSIRLRVTIATEGKAPVDNRLDLDVKGDASLCTFVDGKQKGRKILSVGDKVFMIVPGASHPIPVSKSQRLMGAASIGDVARLRLSKQYRAALGEDSGGAEQVLDLTAISRGAAYPSAVLTVGKDDGLARKLTLVLASGKPAKEVAFTAYDEKRRVRTMTIRDLVGKTQDATTLTFESYEPKTLDPAIFDPEHALERR